MSTKVRDPSRKEVQGESSAVGMSSINDTGTFPTGDRMVRNDGRGGNDKIVKVGVSLKLKLFRNGIVVMLLGPIDRGVGSFDGRDLLKLILTMRARVVDHGGD